MQSQVQSTDFNEVSADFNVPESWKWENQSKVNDKKERKGKNKNRKKKNKKQESQGQQKTQILNDLEKMN